MRYFVTSWIVLAQVVARARRDQLLRRRTASGQGMAEYALILAFIAILVMVALRFLSPAISNTLNTVANSF